MAGEPLKLHPYQENAADALYESDGIVAVLPMGAGKTLATLVALRDLFVAGEIDHAIIWAPKRVAQTVWETEIEKFGIPLTVTTLAGLPPKSRAAALTRRSQILVVNYELADWLKDQGVRATGRTAVVFDEVSRLKSAKGRRRKSVMAVSEGAAMRWGLTGTPKGNGPIDLWGQADAVQPGVWGRSFYPWRAQYFRALDRNGFQHKILDGCEEILDENFAALSFYLPPDQIPASPEPVFVTDRVIMPAEARRQYAEFEDELVLEMEDGLDIMVEHEVAVGMKCRQIASGFIYDEDQHAHWLHSAKLDALQEIIEDSGENILVLYQFLPEVEAMRERWPHLEVLGGETSDAQAVDIMKRWNEGKVPLLAGHPASMGHGLNLQFGGRRVVWFSLTWSLEEFQQANARLARQGQALQVYVHLLVSRGTIDTKVAAALRAKDASQEQLFDVIRNIN